MLEKRMTRVFSYLVAAGLVACLGSFEAEAQDHQYVGAAKCKSCHSKDLMGDQYGAWKDGVHAGALETLKSEKATKIATERGVDGPPHEAAECLRCHVTAFEAEASAIKYPIAKKDGVQCESCHGPGNGYRKKKVMADREQSIAKGMWEPGKNAEVCTACHNEESPTANPFDFAAAKEKIKHPIPEDVKGNYIALEKKLKAEKRAKGGGDQDED